VAVRLAGSISCFRLGNLSPLTLLFAKAVGFSVRQAVLPLGRLAKLSSFLSQQFLGPLAVQTIQALGALI
jgi:hypothetical protein